MVRPVVALQAADEQIERLPVPPEPVAGPALPLIDAVSPDALQAKDDESPGGQPLTLPDAIALAYRRQPRLRVYLESIEQARGLSDVAYAPFLPTLGAGYSVGGYDLNVGGVPVAIGSVPGYAVVPPGFALPVGLNIQTNYELAEMKLQWLICDFGRRMGRYNAAKLGVDIRQLQTDRAFQTIANEVAISYYSLLRTQALLRISREAVFRDEDELDIAKKLEKGGVIEREKVLRAEVKLAESHRLLDASEEAVAVASTALNLAIGLQRNESARVVEPNDIPIYSASLPDCLQLAIAQRKEFAVAQQSIHIAQVGTRVAKADFAPRIVGEAAAFDLRQGTNDGHADIGVGFIKLEWNFFEGGKRKAEFRIADSKVREAMAQAESIADTIAFQVNETYRRMATARLGIEPRSSGGCPGDRKLPAGARPGSQWRRHADRNCRRRDGADPRPTELFEFDLRLFVGDRQAELCHGDGSNFDNGGSAAQTLALMSEQPTPPPSSPSPPPPSTPAAHLFSAIPQSRRKPLLALGAVMLLVVFFWIYQRATHSITDDAFVESHIVNITPEMVSGRIVRSLVDENDSVERGQVLAEIDPTPYLDRVRVAQAKLDAATAELKRQEADLQRLRLEVPIQIAIAGRTLAAAKADHSKAEEALKLTRDDVEKGIDEAQAAVAVAEADSLLAEQEFGRFTSLFREEAVPLRRSQEVTRSRDSAKAQLRLAQARLAKALAGRTQIGVAERSSEAAGQSAEKADKGVALAQTGDDQVHVVELLVEVKKQTAAEARRGLESAQHDLEYTRIRAPFSGVVVKRYRHLGDFASAGVAILSMVNPELLYVEANLEETRLPGVAPGNAVSIEMDAFSRPFRGRVLWINKSTGAQFALLPRNVVSGEFTKVVQRVPVRIQIERDDRWPQLRAGLSARVSIRHGPGDPAWAAEESRRLNELETRFNQAALDAGSVGEEQR